MLCTAITQDEGEDLGSIHSGTRIYRSVSWRGRSCELLDVQTQRLFAETEDERHLLALSTERGSEVVQVSSQCSQVETG
jgi:hypothetical protein